MQAIRFNHDSAEIPYWNPVAVHSSSLDDQESAIPFSFSRWSGFRQSILVLLFVLIFAGGNPVELLREQNAGKNGCAWLKLRTHRLWILARIRKRKRAMHRHLMHHHLIHQPRLRLLHPSTSLQGRSFGMLSLQPILWRGCWMCKGIWQNMSATALAVSQGCNNPTLGD